MNIVLIGFMGTGKTVAGRMIADKLKFEFIDTDESIERDTGLSIGDIFKKKGEPFFREVESRIIALVSLADNTVISTGGGVPLRESNLVELERNGVVVCLEASVETILKRLDGDKTRPLLIKPDPAKEIENLLESRKKYYKRCGLSINTDNLSVLEITERIIEFVNEKNNTKTKR